MLVFNKMQKKKKKHKKIPQCRNISKIQNIVERGKINNRNTQIHVHSLSWLGTVTSIKVAGLI